MKLHIEKVKSLSQLQNYRKHTERDVCQTKLDNLIEAKTLLAQRQKQIFDSKAQLKVKSTLKASQSEVLLHSRPNTSQPIPNYVYDPPVKTQKKLFQNRKEDFLRDMRKCEEEYANHKNAEQRLNHRENCSLRVNHKEPKLKIKKREEFEPNVKYGIHNNPLPHFGKHLKDWWTAQSRYCDQPKENSNLKYNHNKMMKNKSDAYLLNQVELRDVPQDVFKQVHCISGKIINFNQ